MRSLPTLRIHVISDSWMAPTTPNPTIQATLFDGKGTQIGRAALYVPKSFDMSASLGGLIVRDVSLRAIHNGWDEFLRCGASVYSGRLSANVAMQRMGSAARGDPVHRAADQLGRLLRTLFLCDYFTKPMFRREIRTVLNRGESIRHRPLPRRTFAIS